MPVFNGDVARAFDEIADLLELQGANPFRVRAHRRASQTVGELKRSLHEMLERGEDLDALPSVGADLAGKITELVTSGRCALLEQLRREVPRGLAALMKLPHLGPQRVRALHDALGVASVDELHAAAEAGRVHGLHGFGPRLEHEILDATAPRPAHAARLRLPAAEEIAASLLQRLRALPDVQRAEAAGSLRRRRDSVGDLDLLVQSSAGAEVIHAFVNFDGVQQVDTAGDTRAAVVLVNGVAVDVRVVAPKSFGAAWMYFTGSKAHNIALRRIAQQRGLKLNEYGLFRGEIALAGRDEESVYAALGLRPIPPELREDRGEIEAARSGELPRLIERADLRGDLHVHTSDSDGVDDLDALVPAARARGLPYIAVTDHSRHLGVTHGLDTARLARQIERIDRLNERLRGFTVLKGI
jgi:DNA polymerase (family 10)